MDINEKSVAESSLLHELEIKLNEKDEAYKRLLAEFDNFRKRTERERLQWIQSAQASLLKDVLSSIDDFERAFASIEQKQIDKVVVDGFYLTYKTLQKMLQQQGVEEIKQTTVFDPELHEAVMQATVEGATAGAVVAVLQKGYMHNGQVIRPAKVSVAA